MTQAGESAGRAVGTGLRTLRRGAVQVGQAGAEAAVRAAAVVEQKLAEGADSGQEAVQDAVQDLVARSRRTSRKLAKASRKTARKAGKRTNRQVQKAAKNVKGSAKNARGSVQDLANGIAKQNPRGRRKWPWLVALAVAAGGAVFVVRSRREEQPGEPATFDTTEAAKAEQARINGNGSAPKSTPELKPKSEPAESELNRRN